MAITKSLRFDIFHRDKFTCQYCGRKPPEVILEIDHIIPVSQNGSDDPKNLVTSCFNCNRGKNKKIIDNAPSVDLDLDLDYLEAEQRLSELLRYKKTKKKLDKALSETISSLQSFFQEQIGTDWIPDTQGLRWILYYHDPSEIEKAIILSSRQSRSNSPMRKWHYACAILRNWRQGEIE